ncbi:hypothetical protein LK533_07865 [Sphingomonas sp. PL-96]|uniref:hypothetical protein n=1 Tax=Sphingomonas sp. PL-96 TaxID=2887201 RepID=UPI001E40E60E|nr:hypothetical protein [Sphingomonas sp. PL-96]MCC2976590.1 hypothetical protein [Sphingomonas sp. PL-96]
MVLDADMFEAGYVATTLQARGLQVVGPFGDAEQARSALAREPKVRAAAVAQDMAIAAPELLDAMRSDGVHVLLLLPSVADAASHVSGDVLAKPFAAYQVADWASAILVGEERDARPVQNVVYLRAAEAELPEA